MKRLLLLAGIAGIIATSSCKKEGSGPSAETSLEDITVPEGFNWATTKAVKFNISVTDSRFGNAVHSVAIYDANPSNGGSLISSGNATLVAPFIEKINLTSALEEVYVVKTSPDGSSVTEKVKISGANVSVAFGEQKGSTSISSARVSAVEPVCDCDDANQIKTNRSNNLESSDNGKTFCVTTNGVELSFNDNSGSVTIKVCAQNVRFSGNLKDKSKLILTRGASLSMEGNAQINNGASIINYGSLTVNASNKSITASQFLNYGSIVANGDFTLNSSDLGFENYGPFRVNGKFIINATVTGVNHDKIFANDLMVNGNGGLYNECALYVKNEFGIDGKFENSGFTNVGYVLDASNPATHINGSGVTKCNRDIVLRNGAIFQTIKIDYLNGKALATGNTSLLKFDSYNNLNGSFSGNLVVYHKNDAQNTIASNKFNDGAVKTNKSDYYMPATGCNPGNGEAPVTNSGNYTLIFEDNWPSKGDFDLNDIVVAYSYRLYKDGNKATKLEGTYTLLASGGDYENGFGIEFPTASSNITLSATNKESIKKEQGQTKAVVVLFDNARAVQQNWNTIADGSKSPTVTYTFTVTFNTPVELSSEAFTLNPFIFQKSTGGKRNEVHLPGFSGTSLANNVLGSGDNSTTMTYVTRGNLPWALNIPVSNFKYPKEKTNIVRAYPSITDWAQNGGNTSLKWYEMPVLQYCYPVAD
ncbi:LruC domain-containing protein [Pararcticibacter amylolyticus]|uniref:DUF4842 domain-containing protein n=1 Tax=Pararcticibacter amylolyticus TaxID=2173175 RepID=A0A2U2PJW0_9SPHI|nr:LruC domain-containing protein [Pararcticibacter amylolyticus]PWG81681.1 hypothetical protein DDR33_04720 [Pararcticibacter amylolyticus]